MKTSIHNKGRSLFVSFIMASALVICLAKNGHCSESEIEEKKEENFIIRNYRSAKEFVSLNKEEILRYCGYVYEALPLVISIIVLIREGRFRNNVDGRFDNIAKQIENLAPKKESAN